MNKQLSRQLGPIIGATLVTKNLNEVVNSYTESLGFTLVSKNTLSANVAEFLQASALTNAPYALLCTANYDEWLTVIEDSLTIAPEPLKHHGWMSLEVNVADVDQLRAKIAKNPTSFKVISEPAHLEMSDDIKACQISGAAGEVIYLTEIQAQVPPFELPMTTSSTGSLFIPVLCTPKREEALAFYQLLNENTGLSFDTKITVLNKAWDKDINHQYPVATIQLNGECLFEIDQVPQATSKTPINDHLPAGIALITCLVDDIEKLISKITPLSIIEDTQYRDGKKCVLLKGYAGELIEIVSR